MNKIYGKYMVFVKWPMYVEEGTLYESPIVVDRHKFVLLGETSLSEFGYFYRRPFNVDTVKDILSQFNMELSSGTVMLYHDAKSHRLYGAYFDNDQFKDGAIDFCWMDGVVNGEELLGKGQVQFQFKPIFSFGPVLKQT